MMYLNTLIIHRKGRNHQIGLMGRWCREWRKWLVLERQTLDLIDPFSGSATIQNQHQVINYCMNC